ncbi:hypothetical protein HAX54_004358 [Datura stramonium]|uniref:Uncharacterized protein n=1 Tax=Datura stramonium TaxID=4076 RepID=A0ABS8T943_DATST|nr:hypothetical protein [Datura stramonium]
MTNPRVTSCVVAHQGRDDVAPQSNMLFARDKDGVLGPHTVHSMDGLFYAVSAPQPRRACWPTLQISGVHRTQTQLQAGAERAQLQTLGTSRTLYLTAYGGQVQIDEEQVPLSLQPELSEQSTPFLRVILHRECTGLARSVQILVGHQVPVMPPKVGRDKLGIRESRILGSLQAVLSRVFSMDVLCTTFNRQEVTRKLDVAAGEGTNRVPQSEGDRETPSRSPKQSLPHQEPPGATDVSAPPPAVSILIPSD